MSERICMLEDLTPHLGVSALVNGEQIAVFRLNEDRVFAVSNFDPFSQANVLSRGITGNLKGRHVIASPIYKQHFDLLTGVCIEDDTVKLKTYMVEINNGQVLIG